jgi:hypothetical protein
MPASPAATPRHGLRTGRSPAVPCLRWPGACKPALACSRTRPDAFIRSMVTAATARPMLNLLLEMKQGRVLRTPVAAAVPMRPRPSEPPADAPAGCLRWSRDRGWLVQRSCATMALMIRRAAALRSRWAPCVCGRRRCCGPPGEAEAGSHALSRSGFDAALGTVLERYVDPIDASPVLTETLKRVVSGLDSYSHFLTADERSDIRHRSRGGSTGMETQLHRAEPGAASRRGSRSAPCSRIRPPSAWASTPAIRSSRSAARMSASCCPRPRPRRCCSGPTAIRSSSPSSAAEIQRPRPSAWSSRACRRTSSTLGWSSTPAASSPT